MVTQQFLINTNASCKYTYIFSRIKRAMVTYEQLRREPGAKALFSNRLTTLEDLQQLVQKKDSAFITLDTEHFPLESQGDRIFHQVGLAFLETIADEDVAQSNTTRPRLRRFYTKNQVRGLTLNINMSDQTQNNLIRLGIDIPKRRRHHLANYSM